MNDRIYLAPMEGLTPRYFRALQAKYFGGVSKYFAPFISPGEQGATGKSLRDILPEQNSYGSLVPQFLVNRAEPFVLAAQQCSDLGYEEVNLNLGCPSGTVFAKGKGSALLADPGKLRELLDGIFSRTAVSVSAKTRIGVSSPDEFFRILEVLKDYPFSELIVHPRTKEQVYGGKPDMDSFRLAYEKVQVPLCYNGNIFSVEDGQKIADAFPELHALMAGRGAIRDPSLPRQMRGGEQMTLREFSGFHDELLEELREAIGSEKQTVLHLLGYWHHWESLFAAPEKGLKAIRKAKNTAEYQSAVRALMSGCEFRISMGGNENDAG